MFPSSRAQLHLRRLMRRVRFTVLPIRQHCPRDGLRIGEHDRRHHRQAGCSSSSTGLPKYSIEYHHHRCGERHCVRQLYFHGIANVTTVVITTVRHPADFWSNRATFEHTRLLVQVTLASMPTARSLLAAVTGPDGRIYAIGGENASGRLDTVEVYDPSTNTWAKAAPMPTARNHLAATMGPDNLIYAIGGVSSVPKIVEAYNPSTNKWTTVASMPTARHGLAAVTGPDGRIYAIGGTGPGGSLNTVEAYDPNPNTWTTVAKHAHRPCLPCSRNGAGWSHLCYRRDPRTTASVSILWKPTTPKRTLGQPSPTCRQRVTRLQPQQAPMAEFTPLEDIPKAEISTPWKPTIRPPKPGLLSQVCLPCVVSWQPLQVAMAASTSSAAEAT